MEESSTKWWIGLGAVAIIGLIIITATTGSIPSIVNGVGNPVADVAVTVQGSWQNYDIPFVTDTVSISSITYSVNNWHNVLFSYMTSSYATVLSTADTAQGKIEWQLVQNGQTVAQGSYQFGLSSSWQTQFTISNVAPGSYTIQVQVYEYWNNGIAGSGWAMRASSSQGITVNLPSSSSS